VDGVVIGNTPLDCRFSGFAYEWLVGKVMNFANFADITHAIEGRFDKKSRFYALFSVDRKWDIAYN